MAETTGPGENDGAKDRDETSRPTMDRDEAFALAYLNEARFNARAAALAVGVPETSAKSEGSRLARKPRVRRIIREHLDASAACAGEVLLFLTRVMRGQVDGARVPLTKRVKAAQTLIRVHGLGRVEAPPPQEPAEPAPDYARLSDAQLAALAEIL